MLSTNDTSQSLHEILILGVLYGKPSIASEYMPVLLGSNFFTTKISKEIWNKTRNYWNTYGRLPAKTLAKAKVFSQEQLVLLDTAMSAADDDATTAMFLLDDMRNTARLSKVRETTVRLQNMLESTEPDLEKMVALLQQSSLHVSSKGVTANLTESPVSAVDVMKAWAGGELPYQQGLDLKLGLPGIDDYVQSPPVGELNYLLAYYGQGKTTLLSSMTANLLGQGNCLYVTCEMPAPAVMAKIVACKTRGKVPMSFWRTLPETMDPATYAKLTKVRFKNDLWFLDVPAGTLTIEQLDTYIVNIEATTGKKVNYLVVDYGDLISPGSNMSFEKVGWSYMTKISEGLSSLSKRRGLITWTASQTGRDSMPDSGSGKLTPVSGKSIWGSIGKNQTGCIMLGFMFTKHPMFPRYAVGVMSVVKNRYGDFYGHLLVHLDYATAQLSIKGLLAPQDLSRLRDVLNIELESIAAMDAGSKLLVNPADQEYLSSAVTGQNEIGNATPGSKKKAKTMQMMIEEEEGYTGVE